MAPASKSSTPCKSWPAPAPLEGLKSRKKPIFKVVSATLGDGGARVAGISLTLDSRVAAVGDPSRAAIELLLGDAAVVDGKAQPHEGLSVARLGPHLAGPGASAEAHCVAVAAALAELRPQVVVLEEAAEAKCEGWAQTFSELLRSEAARTFRGALVARVARESPPLRKLCAERWVGEAGRVWQEELPSTGPEIIEDALGGGLRPSEEPKGPAKGRRARQDRQAEEEAEVLIEQMRELSDYCFEEDLTESASSEKWTVTILVEPSPGGGARSLRGYLCYKMYPPPRAEMHLTRLATHKRHRGRGYAAQLMAWFLERAAQMPRRECASITCSAFDGVVRFYQRFGFVVTPRPPEAGEEDNTGDEGDPQTWMELQRGGPDSSALVSA